jgi:hypothetical protein
MSLVLIVSREEYRDHSLLQARPLLELLGEEIGEVRVKTDLEAGLPIEFSVSLAGVWALCRLRVECDPVLPPL